MRKYADFSDSKVLFFLLYLSNTNIKTSFLFSAEAFKHNDNSTRYFYVLKIYGAILPQNKQILCRYFTMEHNWTAFSRETKTNWQRATS
jgi:hypothetical protein